MATPGDHLLRLHRAAAALAEQRSAKASPAVGRPIIAGGVAPESEAAAGGAMWTERYQPQKPSQVLQTATQLLRKGCLHVGDWMSQ